MRDTGLWAAASLLVGIIGGVAIERERAATSAAEAARASAAFDARACSDACAADARRVAGEVVRAVGGVALQVERLREETVAAWGGCAVPGVWHDLGVVTLPEARGER